MSQSIPHDEVVVTQADPARRDRHVFAILLALYFLILYPLLRADRAYHDDLKRALIGRTGWDSNGRPLTTLLMKLLQCYDHALVDISPLTQIGAVAILAWAGVLIARRYDIRPPWMAALITFPLGAQPFFLENLSYKFDSLSMAVALFLALLPWLTLKDTRRGWWLGVLALFASLNFYQPAINACLAFILLDLVMGQLHELPPRPLLRRLRLQLGQIGLAMLIYQLVVGIHIHGWVAQQTLKIRGLHDVPVIWQNFIDFYTYIGDSFNLQWWRYFGPVLIVLALFPVVIGIRYALKAQPRPPRWLALVYLASSPLLPLAGLVCVLGPMLVLLKPEIMPRVLMGVGPLLVAGLIVMQAALRQWQWSSKWTLSAAGMLALGMCTFASAYGNALGAQKAYEDRIASHLADDIAQLKAGHSIRHILLDGSIGYAPITAHIVDQFPLVRSLIVPYLSVQDNFHTHMFLLYYITDVTDLRFEPDKDELQRLPSILARSCLVPASTRTAAYSLHLVDDIAVVVLRSASQRPCK